jgi:DNA modification methylase
MGSGTTAGVALRNGRQYMGCELNPEYGELQQNRIKDVSKSTTIEKIESEDGTAVNIVDIFDTLFSRE